MIVVAIPAVALAVLTLAAFGGRWVWWLDTLSNFRPQYIPVLLILGTILMAGRWRRTGAGVLLAAGINLVVVLPLFVGSPGEPTFGAPTVRVMTFNLLSNNENYSEVFGYIAAAQPDLVLLHESSHPWEVAAATAATGFEVVRTQDDDLIFGTLVLVRGAGIEVVPFGFATSQPRAVEIKFTPTGWSTPLKVLSAHPVSPTTAERASIRDEQMAFATEWAAAQVGPYVVAGDLNSTPWSWAFRDLVARGGLRNSQIGFGLQPTYSEEYHPLLRIPIDHLLHSPALGVRDRKLGPTMGSNHYPVIVDLELRG